MSLHFTIRCVAFLLLSSWFADGQQLWMHREVGVNDLPVRLAKADDPAGVLVASLETVFHDPTLCCGKNSALGDAAISADPQDLSSISGRLGGRHLLSDGRPINVTAEYVPSDKVAPNLIIAPLTAKRAILIQWNSHLYVLYGVIYEETVGYSADSGGGGRDYSIQKLLLIDTCCSDSRRYTTFERQSEDWKRVQGLLTLEVARQ